MKNVFDQPVLEELIARINKLEKTSQPLWGKMNVAQMLAHCNVTYELAYENKHPKPNIFKRIFLNLFVKNSVVSEKPYKKNTPTAPVFKVTAEKDFEREKKRLLIYLRKTFELGENHFEGRESHSFGRLTAWQWNNMFYKHLDHHLTQFAV